MSGVAGTACVRAYASEAKCGFDQCKTGNEVAESRQCSQKSASQRVRGQLARQERGANRGRADVEGLCLRSVKLRAGNGRREKSVCGLPRERNGLHSAELAAVVTKEDGVGGGVSDTLLARNGCRESCVARCPLAVW